MDIVNSAGLIVRIIAYALMVPGSVFVALHYFNRGLGYRRVAGLFGLYSLAHVIALCGVVLRVAGLERVVPDVAALLTPVVLGQAVLYGWLMRSWLPIAIVREFGE